MPIVPSPGRILVTGVNGYIAAWIVRLLLEQGYSVRGTVRSADKGRYLTEYFKMKGYGPDTFEVVVVDDITKEGAFDDLVKDVDAIEHTASPLAFGLDDPQDFIQPALKGTVSVLQSALKYGINVKRVVITSSSAAVMAPPSKPTVFSEKDWNTTSPEEVKKYGRGAPMMSKYRSSKVLAEKAAWEFYRKHKAGIQWELVVINPPFVFGPPIQEINGGPSGLNVSLKSWYDVVVGDAPKTQEFLSTSNTWVDVRDVALSHILALQKDSAGGERIIISAGPFNWQYWLNVANSIEPYPLAHQPAKGIPGLEKIYTTQYNTEKERSIFGIKFKTSEETTRDILEDFQARGW